jgi:hypothetical protein
MNTYSHVMPTMQEQAADVIDKVFEGTCKSSKPFGQSAA